MSYICTKLFVINLKSHENTLQQQMEKDPALRVAPDLVRHPYAIAGTNHRKDLPEAFTGHLHHDTAVRRRRGIYPLSFRTIQVRGQKPQPVSALTFLNGEMQRGEDGQTAFILHKENTPPTPPARRHRYSCLTPGKRDSS